MRSHSRRWDIVARVKTMSTFALRRWRTHNNASMNTYLLIQGTIILPIWLESVIYYTINTNLGQTDSDVSPLQTILLFIQGTDMSQGY